MRSTVGGIVVAGLLTASLGCQNSGGQKQPFGSRLFPGLQQQPAAVVAPPAPVQLAPAAPQPYGGNPSPAAPFSVAPPNNGFAPAPPNNNPMPMAPAGPGAGVPSPDTIAQSEYRWKPAPDVKPDPDAKPSPGASAGDDKVLLLPPEPIGDKDAQTPSLYPPDVNPKKPAVSATALPVGIPQFTPVMDNVAAGLRPALDEGLDWLQAKGYRTVLHVCAPGMNDDADKTQVEKRGMKYVRLEASAATLSKKEMDDFNLVVRNVAGHPLFVYDKDGSLSGGLWYLYFRTVDSADDEIARVRANALGLRPDHRDMWAAIEKLLEPR